MASVVATANARMDAGHHTATTPPIPYQSEDMCDVGLFLRFNPGVYDRACQNPLPEPTKAEEELGLIDGFELVDVFEDEEGPFTERILDAESAVALTEEAVETATADIIAHVERAEVAGFHATS